MLTRWSRMWSSSASARDIRFFFSSGRRHTRWPRDWSSDVCCSDLESNADRPDDYRELMLTLIEQWQRDWNQPDLPFLFVQLANYMEPRTEPVESSWARLREAQLQTLEADHTAMAVAIDLGEWNDIHPLNKKDVGERLALAARHTAYGEEIPYSGPQFEAMEVERNRAVLSFSHR